MQNNAKASRKRGLSRPLKLVRALALLLTLAVGGYVLTTALKPLPELKLNLATELVYEVEAGSEAAEQAVANQALPTAIGWLDSDRVFSNDETAYSLASISKLVTVLVTLEAQPLDPDTSTWGSITWGYDDWLLQQELIALDGVAYPTAIGTEVPLVDVFKLIFLPSANDYAAAYAYSVFGDNDTFIAFVNSWAARNGIDSLQFVEPTGMHEDNMANAGDLVKIARMALEDPVISQFISTKTAYTDVSGELTNTNPLLGLDPTVIGVKTGRSSMAGFNFLVAATQDIGSREVVRISATMGRDSIEARAESGREMLAALAELPSEVNIIEQGKLVATVETWQKEIIELRTDLGVTQTMLPGESADVLIELLEPQAGQNAGSVSGAVTVTGPAGIETTAVLLLGDITEPSLWYRLTHPGIVWG